MFLTIREQALALARANKKAEPSIDKIFWFPDEQEIRLVELEASIPLFCPLSCRWTIGAYCNCAYSS